MDASTPAVAARPLRAWPALLLTALFWGVRLATLQLDMAMFPRFMAKLVGNALLLLLFLVLWLANGTVPGRMRLLGFGLLVAGATLGGALADPSFGTLGFLMEAIPFAVTVWTAWLVLGRVRPGAAGRTSLAGAVLLAFGAFDLLRFEGLDARLVASVGWRWASTPEQELLRTRAAAPIAPPRPARTWTLAAGDVAEFRGAARDGAVRGVRAGSRWTEAPAPLWKRAVGPGWSGMIVVDGFLVTQEQRGESEAVACYDAETGAEQWIHLETARFSEGLAGPGPRATPTFRDGRIWALGAAGRLVCLDASTGKPVWLRDLARETDAPPPQWGFSSSPLVVDGKVLVFIGGAKPRGLLALDAATGGSLWSVEGKESYASPQLLTIRGRPQVLMHDSSRLAAVSPADGAVLWQQPGDGESALPMLQPQLLTDGSLLVGAAGGIALLEFKEEAGGLVVAERWSSRRLKPSFNDYVVHGGHVYGLDDGVLACVDLRTGERAWKSGRYGGGQLVLVAESSLLVVLSEMGELALVPARPEDPGEIPRFAALAGKTWNHPVVVRDRVYVRNGAEMACFRLPGGAQGPDGRDSSDPSPAKRLRSP